MIYKDIMKIMPEDNRAATYSPEQMDCEWFPWDCDNVSREAPGGDEEEDDG
jgi:hypothetical protein